jgi:hypothetical protein
MSLLLAALLVVKLPLVVNVYDTTGISASELDIARVNAGRMLTAIGIEPIWRPCHASGCIGRPKPRGVAIRIVMSGAWSHRASLGFSTIDVKQHGGTLATVYADRVEALAAEAGVERAALLGRVFAHEIGHLLLGTTQHARYGLMRALWLTTELRRDQPLDWMFSGREGAEMRRHLMARAAEVTLPEEVVAELGPGDAYIQLAYLSFAAEHPDEVWKRSRRFIPGTKVIVTLEGAPPIERHFVCVDDAELTVLNLSGANLPRRQLLLMASDHPDWMSNTWKTIYKDNSLRVGPQGVFQADRKLADLAEVVELIPRARVVSIVKK